MAKVFTQEEREKIKWQVVELVRQSGRETLRQLEAKTGATRYAVEVLLMSNPSVMTMKREKLRSKHIVMSGAMNERD